MTTVKINRKDWLTDMPKLIKTLKLNYNFYYSGQYSVCKKRIQELVKQKENKNRHKIVLYTNHEDWYLVVYSKKNPVIYWCPEYKGNTWGCIRYFEKKFRLAYEEAVKQCQEKEERSMKWQ